MFPGDVAVVGFVEILERKFKQDSLSLNDMLDQSEGIEQNSAFIIGVNLNKEIVNKHRQESYYYCSTLGLKQVVSGIIIVEKLGINVFTKVIVFHQAIKWHLLFIIQRDIPIANRISANKLFNVVLCHVDVEHRKGSSELFKI